MVSVGVIVGVALLSAVLGFVCGRWGRTSCDTRVPRFTYLCKCGYICCVDDAYVLAEVIRTHLCRIDTRSCPNCGGSPDHVVCPTRGDSTR